MKRTQLTTAQIQAFRRRVFAFYKRNGRHSLPFRKTTDPYRIAVSEIMLQQTQVSRVLPKYEAWIKKWPSWQSLAKSTPSAQLTVWSGLGYNRRALFLGKMAKAVCDEHKGRFPASIEKLLTLPGIGPYTANAILIFAFNANRITIDTNIRRVLIHELDLPKDIPAKNLEAIALRCLPKGKARDWHNALMDYSALSLPRRISGIPPISKQGKFAGSNRQIRGAIVRALTNTSMLTNRRLLKQVNTSSELLEKILRDLEKEGLVQIHGRQVRLP